MDGCNSDVQIACRRSFGLQTLHGPPITALMRRSALYKIFYRMSRPLRVDDGDAGIREYLTNGRRHSLLNGHDHGLAHAMSGWSGLGAPLPSIGSSVARPC